MKNAYQDSVIAQLLEAIINQSTYEGEATSVIAQILLSILNGTPYEGEAISVIAQLFVKLKAKIEGESFEPYEGEPVSNIAKILISIIEEEEYNYPPESRIAELLLELKAELEAYTEVTVSGVIAGFITNVSKPLVELKAGFVATQESGTPTPESPKTISGVSALTLNHCKANICEESFEKGFISASGVETPSGTSIRSVNYNPCDPSKNYYASTFADPSCYIMFYDENKVFIERKQANNQIVKSSSNARYFRFSCYNYGNYGEYDPINKPVCINNPASETEYSAYNNTKTIIELGDTYYGGQLIIDKNGHRQIIATCAGAKIREFSWSYNSQYGFMTTGTLSNIKQTANNEVAQDLKCEIYKPDTAQHVGSGGVDNTIGISAQKDIRLRDNNYTDADEFKADKGNYYIVYPLDIPSVISLPDGYPINSFAGANNIFNDSDVTEVTYLYKGEPPVVPLGFGLGAGNPDDSNEEDNEQSDIIEEEA